MFGIIPLILCFLVVCSILYVAIRWMNRKPTRKLPQMKRRDFRLDELRLYNGDGPDGRILMAVNSKVFDVTNNGQSLYAKGKDVSRALACFKANASLATKEYDDLSDLSPTEMECLKEWELQFLEQYDYVGRLLRPGEPHHVYDDSDIVVSN